MEKHKQLFEIIIDKNTDRGKSRKNRTRMRKLIIMTVSKTDKTKEKDVFRLPAWENDTHLTMFTDCSTEAFELLKTKLEDKYPKVCSFKQYNLA